MSNAFAIPVARPRLPDADALLPYLRRIDAGRWYSNFGPLNAELEARLAHRYGLEPECVASVSSATMGLCLALLEVAPTPGAFCLTPSWTFPASAQAAVLAGLVPLFVDVEPDGMLHPEGALRAIAGAPGPVAAVMPVAVYGQGVDAGAWDAFSQATGVPVVTDAAPSFDAVRPGRRLSVVSLHATKILGVGEGGFVMSTDAELVAQVRRRGNFGFVDRREARLMGANGKLSEYAAAVGLAGLDSWIQRRASFQAVADRYRTRIGGIPGARLAVGWGEGWLASTCVLHARTDVDLLAARLAQAGIDTRAWWGRGVHLHAAFREAPRLPLPVTGELAACTLGLPCYIDMSEGEIDRVCSVLAQALAESAPAAAE